MVIGTLVGVISNYNNLVTRSHDPLSSKIRHDLPRTSTNKQEGATERQGSSS